MNENLRRQYLTLLDIPIWEERSKNHSQKSAKTVELVEATIEDDVESMAIFSSLKDPVALFSCDDADTQNHHTQKKDQTRFVQKRYENNDERQREPILSEWALLPQIIQNCRYCHFAEMRLNPVFGYGAPNAEVLFITDVPMKDEVTQKRAIVGAAEALFIQMLAAIEKNQNAVYITPFIKCRPNELVEPTLHEKDQCFHYLKHEIETIQPKIIVSMGRMVSQLLLEKKQPHQELCKVVHEWNIGEVKYPFVVTHSPAMLLNNPRLKNEMWAMLKTVRKYI